MMTTFLFAVLWFGSKLPERTISTPAQPEAKLTVKGDRFVWRVADYHGAKAETKEVATPWQTDTRSLAASWTVNGETIRRELYPLPGDFAAFKASLEEEKERIVIPVDLPEDAKLTVAIDDKDGRRVRNLVCGIDYKKGHHDIVWDGYTEDGVPVLPGTYKVRIARHPGLSYRYLGYFMNGHEPNDWIPWGPNHTTFKGVIARGEKVAFSAYFTEGGFSTVVLDGKTGKRLVGFSQGWSGANDSMFLVDGSSNRFYAVRGKLADKSLDVNVYGWDESRRLDVVKKGVWPKTVPVAATLVGKRLTVINAETKTADAYELVETPGRTTVSFVSSTPLKGEPAFVKTFEGELYSAPEKGLVDMTTDGREIFALKEGSHVVHVYDFKTKKPTRTIGLEGGAYLGAWQKDRLVNPKGLAIDEQGFLWISEFRFAPKRVSKWDAKTGHCVFEKFGPSAYGYPGMGMDPDDPSRWMAYDTLWRFDEKTGEDHPVAVAFPRDFAKEARPEPPLPNDAMHYTWLRRAGRTFVMAQNKATVLYELKGDRFLPLAMIASVSSYQYAAGRLREKTEPIPALMEAYRKVFPETSEKDLVKKMRGCRNPIFWKDTNRDGKVQADEYQILPEGSASVGYWGAWPEALDFTLAMTSTNGENCVLNFDAGDLTGDKLPDWDLKRAFANRTKLTGRLPSGTQPFREGSLGDTHGNTVLLASTPYMLGIDRTGDLRWHLWNPFPDVHGAQKAGLPVPGEMHGILFNLGVVPYSKTADVFAAVNDHGRIFFLTTDGLYLDELFSDCRVSAKNDESLVGGEAFGGSFAYDRVNRRAILQAGGYRRYEILGLDKVVESRAEVSVSPKQVEVALRRPPVRREAKKVAAPAVVEAAALAQERAPKFVRGAPLRVKAGQSSLTAEVAVSKGFLSLRWSVDDPSPWVNNGTDPYLMFKTGDCFDFQYLDKDKLPNRLMISPKAGSPQETQIVWYRHQLKKGEKGADPHDFSSPWRTHHVADVQFPTNIAVDVVRSANQVSVAAKIPLAYFGGTIPKDGLVADIGVILGDADGKINLCRAYWSDKETGLVNDVPGEIIPAPKKWGRILPPKGAASDGEGNSSLRDEPMENFNLRPLGALVNPCGLLVNRAKPRGFPMDSQVGPVYDAKRELLYMSAGWQRVVAMRLDGTRVATYTLEKAPDYCRRDMMAITPEGDVVVLAGGLMQFGQGNVYVIPAGSRDGTVVKPLAKGVAAMSASVRDGRVIVVRRVPDSKQNLAKIFFLDLKTGEERLFADFPIEGAAYYSCLYDWDLKGDVVAVVRHVDLYRFAADGTWKGPTKIFGSREISMSSGLFCDGWLWALCGGTIKRLDPATFAAAPGVVLGGASGFFLGRVDMCWELDTRGFCKVGENLYAAGSERNGSVWILAWDEAKGALRPVRRLGAIADPQNLVIDDDGLVFCDDVVWSFDAEPLAAPLYSVRKMSERATAVLPDGVLVHVFDTHQHNPSVMCGRLREEDCRVPRGNDLARDPSEGTANKWAERPYQTRLVSVPDAKGLFELQAVHTNGLVRAYRVNRDGHCPARDSQRVFRKAPPDTNRHEAADGSLKAVTDTRAGTLSLYAVAADGRERLLDQVKGLSAPTLVALRKGRLAVYESETQRLLRYSLAPDR